MKLNSWVPLQNPLFSRHCSAVLQACPWHLCLNYLLFAWFASLGYKEMGTLEQVYVCEHSSSVFVYVTVPLAWKQANWFSHEAWSLMFEFFVMGCQFSSSADETTRFLLYPNAVCWSANTTEVKIPALAIAFGCQRRVPKTLSTGLFNTMCYTLGDLLKLIQKDLLCMLRCLVLYSTNWIKSIRMKIKSKCHQHLLITHWKSQLLNSLPPISWSPTLRGYWQEVSKQ